MAGILTAADQYMDTDPKPVRDLRHDAAQNFSKRGMPSLAYGLGIDTTLPFTWNEIPWKSVGCSLTVEEAVNADIYTGTQLQAAPDTAVTHVADLIPVRDKLQCFHYSIATPLIITVPPEQDAAITVTAELTEAIGGSHVLVLAGHNSTVDIVERIESSGQTSGPRVMTTGTEVVAAEGSTVTYTVQQELGEDVTGLMMRKSRHGKDAAVNWFDTHFGGGVVKSEVSTVLQGRGSTTKNMGAYFAQHQQHFDLLNAVQHRAPHTDSLLKTRGVQKDGSSSVYRGKIDIGEDASDVTGSQKASSLLLSDRARNSSLPILEINNNEVDTEHAATSTQLSEEKLFYMNSRGITDRDAVKLVVNGFYDPVLKHMPDAPREHVQNQVMNRLQ